MIALIQRVSEAKVIVNNKNIGEIQQGVLAFIGVEKNDSEAEVTRLVDKVLSYRIFADSDDKMNLSVEDIKGGLLLVPQFTLAADTQKGCRPSFSSAAAPETGKRLFDEFVKQAKNKYQFIETGQFGADMKISLLNDGPVTFWLQVKK
ncbi:MAG: D-aminoacyl-tRNA deacylase [Gammaproteobacteria bacterium]|nr:D-aminoacyl-tRNA deacylase [Gammaproteobacteria bacterium]MCW8986350.1 D-aminoacyl-tRNA deacylase [Gammaproteobacteria bacterium]